MLTVVDAVPGDTQATCPVCGGQLTAYPASIPAALPARVVCIFGHYGAEIA